MIIKIKHWNISKEARTFMHCYIEKLAELLSIGRYERTLIVGFSNKLPDHVGGTMNGFYDPKYWMRLSANEVLERLIKITAHEMIHVKQHVKGELQTKDFHSVWKGKIFTHHQKYFCIKMLGMPDLIPWESEAYAMMNLATDCALELLPEAARYYYEANNYKRISEL